jgi:hypothetical protein
MTDMTKTKAEVVAELVDMGHYDLAQEALAAGGRGDSPAGGPNPGKLPSGVGRAYYDDNQTYAHRTAQALSAAGIKFGAVKMKSGTSYWVLFFGVNSEKDVVKAMEAYSQKSFADLEKVFGITIKMNKLP